MDRYFFYNFQLLYKIIIKICDHRSGGSDNIVNLWRIASCSSAPWLRADDNAGEPGPDSNDPADIKARLFTIDSLLFGAEFPISRI